MKTGIYWQDPGYQPRSLDFIFDPSLVLYLPLHQLDGASFMSKDAYGHLGTVTGALWTPRGRSFDGTDDGMTVPHCDSLSIGGALSVITWIKTTHANAHQNIIIKNQDTNGNHINYQLGIWDDNKPLFRIGVTSAEVKLFADDAISTDVWYFIAGVYDLINMVLHVDSTSKSVAETRRPYQNTELLSIGKWKTTIWPFKGLTGEVMVYNRALTPLEVQHNYLATKWRYQ